MVRIMPKTVQNPRKTLTKRAKTDIYVYRRLKRTL